VLHGTLKSHCDPGVIKSVERVGCTESGPPSFAYGLWGPAVGDYLHTCTAAAVWGRPILGLPELLL